MPKPLKNCCWLLLYLMLLLAWWWSPFLSHFFIKWLQLHNPDCIFYLGFVFVIGLFSIASFFNIGVAISADRLLAVQLHLRYQALGTHTRVAVFSTLTLFLVPYAVLTAIMWGIGTFCLLVTTAIYCKICFITRRHKRQIQQLRELEAQARQNSEMRNLATIMKTAVGVLYVYFAFLVWYFPRFILLDARIIIGPNIVRTSFSLYRHTLMFFNSTLNLVIYCWRMRQTRHVNNGHTTNSIHQSWVVIQDRKSDIHTAIHRFFRAHSNFHMIGIFWHSVFHLMFVEIRFLIPLLEHFRCRAPFHLGPCSDGHSIQFNFLCKVLIWPRHIFRLC